MDVSEIPERKFYIDQTTKDAIKRLYDNDKKVNVKRKKVKNIKSCAMKSFREKMMENRKQSSFISTTLNSTRVSTRGSM